jgi:hypothetical protein
VLKSKENRILNVKVPTGLDKIKNEDLHGTEETKNLFGN